MSQIVDDLCFRIEQRLQGSGLTFALVLWKPGHSDDAKSVGIASPPAHQAEAPMAARTAAAAFEAQQAASRGDPPEGVTL